MKKFSRIFLYIAIGFTIGTFLTMHKLVPKVERLAELTQEFVVDSARVIAQYRGTLMHTRLENTALNLEVLLMDIDDRDVVLDDLWQATIQTVSNISEHLPITIIESEQNHLSINDRLQLLRLQYDKLSAKERRSEIRLLTKILEDVKKSVFMLDDLSIDDLNIDSMNIDDINIYNNQKHI